MRCMQKKRIVASKLTQKFQASIPKEVRELLKLKQGDQIVYEISSDNTVTIRKAPPMDVEFLNALESTLTEWECAEDEEGYKFL
jgi:antitoxin PrlF